MNKEWSSLNSSMQLQLKKPDTFQEGLETLFRLRTDLMETLLAFRDTLTPSDFSAIPFLNAKGYHSKTIAYSLWHIFRIEDICMHTLIQGDDQIFFSENYQELMHAPIITTGNELVKQEIADFSKELDPDALYAYAEEVKADTEQVLRCLTFDMLKQKIPPERRETLLSLNVVSDDEKAAWLVDYWCQKNIRGLIQMPFSRHWIMHTEASIRIAAKLTNRNPKAAL